MPHEFLEMEEMEKAFVIASIEKKWESDKKEKERLEKKRKYNGR